MMTARPARRPTPSRHNDSRGRGRSTWRDRSQGRDRAIAVASTGGGGDPDGEASRGPVRVGGILATGMIVLWIAQLTPIGWVRAQNIGEAGIDSNFQEKLPRWMAEAHVPAVGIGIIEGGKLKESRVIGELREGVPAPPDTIFQAASLTKPIAAMVTLKLVDAGKWDLDEPLSRYWVDPDIADDPRHQRLTTRMVLSHRTGFPNWRFWNRPTTRLGFDFTPGSRYQYSGEGFVYLRRAMERKFGEDWEEIAGPMLLDPLRMTDTSWYLDEADEEPRFAVRHDDQGNPVPQEVIGERRGSIVAFHTSPAGALVTTVEDYSKFAVDVVSGAGLSEATWLEMVSPQVAMHEGEESALSYGLGWVLVNGLSNGEYAIVHGGKSPGVRTFVVLLPESKRGLVILTNGDDGDEVCKRIIGESIDVGVELLQRLADYL